MTVYDRWHLVHPPEGAKRCSAHRKVPSANHGQGLRWQVRGGIDLDGKPLPKENFEFEDDAKNRDAERKAAVRAGNYVDEKAGKVTFKEYAEKLRKTHQHDYGTAERLEQYLRIHCYPADGSKDTTPGGGPAIGHVSMTVLSRRVSLMRDWAAGLGTGTVPLSANTARQLIGRVSAVFDAAIDDLIISRNPLKSDSFERPKKMRKEVTAWPPERVMAVCDALPGELRSMGYLAASTGARQGEVFGVAVGDLDFLRRTVRYEVQAAYVGGRAVFKPLKNDKARTVPVGRAVVPVLSEHIRLHPPVMVTLPWSEKGSPKDGKPVTRMLVFTTPGGQAYHHETVNRHWRAARTRAGVPDGRGNGMHVLRHSFASKCLSDGLNPAKVAAWIGDTLAVLLDTYSHFLPDDEEKGRGIVDGYLSPGAMPCGTSECPENDLPTIPEDVRAGQTHAR